MEREERFLQCHPLHCTPDASLCPMNPFLRIVTVGLQRQSLRLKSETDGVRRNSEHAMGGLYATRRMVLTLGAEQAATGMSLTALTDHVHSDGAIPPRQNYPLLMINV